MTEPLRRRNKNTGEVAVSTDGGATWKIERSSAGMGDLRVAESQMPMPAAERTAPQQPSTATALGRGAGQGASLGFGDEMGGVGARIAAALTDDSGIPRQAGRGFSGQRPGPSDYEVGRDAERGANAAAQAAHPYAYGAGEIAGGLAPAVATGGVGSIGAGASTAARVAAASGAGGLLGGAAGAGLSEADTAGGVAGDAAMGAGAGAALGGAAELAAPYVGAGARWAGDKLRGAGEAAKRKWVEQKLAAAGAERAGLKKLRDRPGGLERYAEGAERLGIGKNRMGVIPASTRQHAEDAAAAAAAANARKNVVSSQIEEAAVGVDGRLVAAEVRKLAKQYGKGPAGKGVRDEIEAIAQGYEELGTVPFSDMNLERQVWGDATNFDAGSVRQQLRKKIYGVLNESMADAADRAAAPAITSIPGAPRPAPDIHLDIDDAAYARGAKDVYSVKETAAGRGGPAGVGATGRPPRGRSAGRTQVTPNQPLNAADVLEAQPATVAMPPPPMGGAAGEVVSPLDPGAGKAWRSAMEDEHIALKLAEMGENKLNQAGNRALSPTDYMAGGLGYAASADPLTAGAMVGANKLARSREHAVAANMLKGINRGANAGANVLDAAARGLERSAPAARGAAAGSIAGGRAPSSAMAQGSGNALDDEKYGALLSQKRGQDREAAYSLLMAQDPEFRSRQRAKAAQAEGDR